QQNLYHARRLFLVSNFHPVAAARIVTLDWDRVKPQLAAFEKQWGDDPSFLDAVARHYAGAREPSRAARYWKRLIAVSPEQHAFRALADSYKAAGDLDKWKATLDAFLEQPDHGLEHAKVRVEIAEHFMARRDWKKALPYADAAAQTWAEWA